MSSKRARRRGVRTRSRKAGRRPWTQKLDLTLASIFIAAAGIILALLTPIHVSFQPHPVETLAVVLAASALLGYGVWRRKLPGIVVATAIIFATLVLGVTSQPTTFDARLGLVWPLRIFVVLVVAAGWALLLGLPALLRRAVVGLGLSTALMLLLIGGTTLASGNPGAEDPDGARLNNNFAPSYLAMDSKGTLYAADLEGSVIWVFDSSGGALGTIRPAAAPPVPTPGPGIVPPGMEYELNMPVLGQPASAFIPQPFSFCGMTVDAHDNLYLVDATDYAAIKVMRFDPQGMITARWPAPADYRPSGACLASDAEHIYLIGVGGNTYALDYDGKQVAQTHLNFEPWAVSNVPSGVSGLGALVAAGPGALVSLEMRDGALITHALKAPPLELQLPLLVRRNGEILFSDHQARMVARWDPVNGTVLGTLGGPGTLPGQLGDIGGLAEDNAGRIYVGDPVNRAIQRFMPDGTIDAVWSAQDPNEEGEGR
jgi:hypothetical protein